MIKRVRSIQSLLLLDTAESLGQGQFRIVLVLDAVPDELVRLVGYIESITDKLVIDLIAVSAYEVGGSQVLVPQRIDAERRPAPPPAAVPQPAANVGYMAEGSEDFVKSIATAVEDQRSILQMLCDWAVTLEREGLVRLRTYHGKRGSLTLLPRLRAGDAGLVTIYNDKGVAWLQFWRSVFTRRAPSSVARVEELLAPTPLGQGNWIQTPTTELLAALTDAYREAATGRLTPAE